MSKKLFGSLITAAVLVASGAQANTVSVDATSSSVILGDSIFVDLNINLTTPTVSGWLDLGYDNTIVSFSSISSSSAVNWLVDPVIDTGSFLDGLYFEAPLASAGAAVDTVLTLEFSTIGTGSANFTVNNHGGSTGFSTGFGAPINIDTFSGSSVNVSAVPVPAAVWLFGSGLLGLFGVARRRAA